MHPQIALPLRRGDLPVISNGSARLAGCVLHRLGRAQEVSAWTVCSLAPADALVLNIGRRNSRFVRQLKGAEPAATVVQLRRPLGESKSQTLPYGARTFHAVISLFSLHYWRHTPDAFSEMARVLTPGGTFVFSELSAEDLPADHKGMRRIGESMFQSVPGAVDYYRWLDRAGLRVLEADSTLSGRHGLVITAEKEY
jgi:SAM-dependent methyltransferase